MATFGTDFFFVAKYICISLWWRGERGEGVCVWGGGSVCVEEGEKEWWHLAGKVVKPAMPGCVELSSSNARYTSNTVCSCSIREGWGRRRRRRRDTLTIHLSLFTHTHTHTHTHSLHVGQLPRRPTPHIIQRKLRQRLQGNHGNKSHTQPPTSLVDALGPLQVSQEDTVSRDNIAKPLKADL